MVLSAMPVGEYDKRLVILTTEKGKITAFAKGARKPNSALLACSGPFAFGEFSLYAGKSSYNIVSAEISNYFGELREDFDSLCYGFYFCEFADYLTKENNDEKNILKLLYQTLRVISKRTIDLQLVKAIYDLKIMALNGEMPQVFSCVKCGDHFTDASTGQMQKTVGRYYFSARSGGILCSECVAYDRSAIQINTSTLYAMQYIISKEVEKLYTFRVTDNVLNELQRCIKRYLECYVDHEFKSLEILKPI
jgi:DNA repair protein RecO (recombination protein O)